MSAWQPANGPRERLIVAKKLPRGSIVVKTQLDPLSCGLDQRVPHVGAGQDLVHRVSGRRKILRRDQARCLRFRRENLGSSPHPRSDNAASGCGGFQQDSA